MKKCVVLLMALILLLASTPAFAWDPVGITTGGTAGTYYPLGGEIAALWMKHIQDLDVSVQSSGGSKDNIIKLNNQEAELATVQNDVMYYAYQGDQDFFNGEVIDSFVAIGSLYPELVQVVVAGDSDIKTIEDLKGKKVSVGAVGSGVYFNAVQLLEMAGLTLDDIQPQYLSFDESSTSFQNRQLDAFFITAGLPNPAIMDVASRQEVRLIGLTEDQMGALSEKYSFYVPVVVEAGTYQGMKEAVTVPSMNAVLICRKELPEDLVYQMTKVLFENKDEMTHAKKEYISAEYGVGGIPVPFHPGAERYFKEIGLLN
ncbi:MAG: TAXI family TRAP transporter solute-binding subunit [Eubacteriales bacterium]|nr:TAXI family TRAP transporter solute-binding subunit [Eubacteriales bacterium]MDD3109563.1 TAXI family TRAP transporter solute-binding subunit [Eubacteriales bacterium]